MTNKCQLCSEPYDENDLKEAEETGKCPYCNYEFEMATIVIDKYLMMRLQDVKEFRGYPSIQHVIRELFYKAMLYENISEIVNEWGNVTEEDIDDMFETWKRDVEDMGLLK